MFLDLTLKRNPGLIEAAFSLQNEGTIRPDTYILDFDTIIENGRLIKEEADKYGIKLYFMTKQFGRNPYIAAELMKLGYEGAVAVDFKEADTLYKNGIKLGHVGHLVQVPSNAIKDMLLKEPEVITVYSLEKAREISEAAVELGISQKIMMRVLGRDDIIYPGQYGGFRLEDLIESAKRIMDMRGVVLYGITSFPCFLMEYETKEIRETNNMKTVIEAREMLEGELGIKITELNTPSATCVSSIKKIAMFGGTHGEPGHGLTGTTPLHAVNEEPEKPSIVYASEISHNFGDKTYFYGGGHYRRSHMENALVGTCVENMKPYKVEGPSDSSIDYYIGLNGKANVGDTAVLAFRTQIFVTRSDVAVVSGIRGGSPRVVGIYDSFGHLMKGGA